MTKRAFLMRVSEDVKAHVVTRVHHQEPALCERRPGDFKPVGTPLPEEEVCQDCLEEFEGRDDLTLDWHDGMVFP